MNCLSEEIIQAYLDGELELMQQLELEVHLADCEVCRAKVEVRKKQLGELKKALIHLDRPIFEVPPFKGEKIQRGKRDRRTQLYWMAGVAATLLIVLLPKLISNFEEDDLGRMKMEEFKMYMDEEAFLSPNDLWHEKSVSFVIMDGQVNFPE